MKIGILTFHWATNYGAILQAYALQEYLTRLGHIVYIIDYKPRRYDFTWKSILKHPRNLLYLRKSVCRILKEKKLTEFRKKYLHMTDRYYRQYDLSTIVKEFDVLVSGSDQVLNPYYTMMGEGDTTSVYYLDFPDAKCVKFGYALSFGCVRYPEEAAVYASRFIKHFDRISVRENSGADIVRQLKYPGDSVLVPDPTILEGSRLFDRLDLPSREIGTPYVCVYMLRRSLPYRVENALYIDDVHRTYSMEEWLSLIRGAETLVTNSYHGMIMAILFRVPFIVELEDGDSAGMNDRFVTLLKKLGLEYRINRGNSISRLMMADDIDWESVEKKLAEFRNVGEGFLKI